MKGSNENGLPLKPHKKNSLVKPGKPASKEFYIDNLKFYQACLEYKESCIRSAEAGKPKPKLSNYIGECLLKIAHRVSLSRNFVGYPYREEMVGDAIENCLMYFDNFDPYKYKNPFSYFTQIVYYAFLRRIEREHKQLYTKYKIQQSKRAGHVTAVEIGEHTSDNEFLVPLEDDNEFMKTFVNKYEAKEARRKTEKAEKAETKRAKILSDAIDAED